MLKFLARYRKFLIAAGTPLVLLVGHYLGQGPEATFSHHAAIWTTILLEGSAFGVYVAPNDPVPVNATPTSSPPVG